MAIQNHPSLYKGGAVELNQRPHVQLYAQLYQRKQAQDDAFDDYIRNLNKSVNAAGVRNSDRPIFDKQLQDWQKFGIENRDAIRSRKGGADIKFQQMHQNLLNLTGESKTEEEKKKPLVEIFLDPAKRDRLSESVISEIESHDQPLYIQKEDGTIERNPNRKSLDYSSVSFNPKPFEQDKFFKQFEDVKRMDMPPVVSKDPSTMTMTETVNSVYDQDAKDLIATRAVTDYMQNPSFKSLVKNLKKEDYNDFFKENYGHDIQNEADLAAAYTLKGLQQKTTTSKVAPDVFERQKSMAAIQDSYARRREAIKQRYRKSIVDYKKAGTKKDRESVLEGFIERGFDEGEEGKGIVGVNGKFVRARPFRVPIEIKDKYTIDKGNQGERVPTKFMMTEDKKYLVPVYPGGSTIKQNNAIPIETFRNDLGKLWLTKKDATAEMGDELDFEDEEEEVDVPVSSPVSQPADNSYSRDELKKAGWTNDQINQASKQGKIKVK